MARISPTQTALNKKIGAMLVPDRSLSHNWPLRNCDLHKCDRQKWTLSNLNGRKEVYKRNFTFKTPFLLGQPAKS